MWSECSWVTKIALMLSGAMSLSVKAVVILLADTPASIRIPPEAVPMYVQFPDDVEKSEQKRAKFIFLFFLWYG